MLRKLTAALAVLWLSACATQPHTIPIAQPQPIEVQILAINDFHGNLETPESPVTIHMADGSARKARFGGAASIAGTVKQLREGQPHSITVSAGDLIGGSPFVSAYFLDEPTIQAMNAIGLDLNAVGNHEFDKGSAELLRMQKGGCKKYTSRVPCRLEPFGGARFGFLAANVLRADGSTIFPGSAIRRFGPVTIGFIGMTLKETQTLVTPTGVAGLRFADEAVTANALVPQLKAAGADTIALLIHQGGKFPDVYRQTGCQGLEGPILDIMDKLDPAIEVVVSGHTHQAYACELDRGGARRLLTSSGRYGYTVTDIRLEFDPATRKLLGRGAINTPVHPDVPSDWGVLKLVKRYTDAAAPAAARVIGTLSSSAPAAEDDSESPAADLAADSMLAATRSAETGGAQIALVNASGIRVDLPAGDIRYEDAFAMMPFGNNLVVMTLTGEQLKAVLEQQYARAPKIAAGRPAALAPSAGFTYAVNVGKPVNERVSDMQLNGRPIDPAGRYRVAVNNYMASGGDGLSGFTAGTELTDRGIIDLDALVAWIAKGQTPPTPNRIRFVSTPRTAS